MVCNEKKIINVENKRRREKRETKKKNVQYGKEEKEDQNKQVKQQIKQMKKKQAVTTFGLHSQPEVSRSELLTLSKRAKYRIVIITTTIDTCRAFKS